ncbi:hypothetical protein FACS1894184_21190 [Clostridia bacterium]|nr:hypothetical protein FACS1894184_21190 [Clostridia bacterium]
MKKHASRILALVIALCMILPLAQFSLAETTYSETLSFTVKNWVKANYYDTVVHTAWMEKMSEYIGKNLDIKWVEMPYDGRNEAMKLYLAAGQYDDVFIAQADKMSLQQIGDAGLLVNLAGYTDELTYYTPWLEDNNNRQRLSTAEGAIYGFGLGEIGEHYGNQQVFVYREDTFVENGLSIPLTAEEFYDAAKQLKTLYPDSYPIGGGIDSPFSTNVSSRYTNTCWLP